MREKRYFIYVILAILLAIGLGFLILGSVVKQQKNDEIKLVEVVSGEDGKDNEFYVNLNQGKSWIDADGSIGAQYDGVFYNNTGIDITDWKIEIQVPEQSYIDSSWNGVYTLEDNWITIKAVDYDANVLKNNSITFGFVMYTPMDFKAKNITIYTHKIYELQHYPLFWALSIMLVVVLMIIIVYSAFELRVRKFKAKQRQDKRIIVQSLKTFANIIDAKDPYTKGHSNRVAKYAKEIARRMEIADEDLDRIYYIALLHDIGKIGISDDVLNKPGKLTDKERIIIEMHTTIGGEILKDFSAIPGIGDGAMYHHEQYAGGGYPLGLQGENIPLFARIICIADAYDAMSSDRCYRPRLEDDNILSELVLFTGKQFDPDIVKYMLAMISDGFVTCIK